MISEKITSAFVFSVQYTRTMVQDTTGQVIVMDGEALSEQQKEEFRRL